MYSTENLPALFNNYNELKFVATHIQNVLEKTLKKAESISDLKSDDSSILFTFLGAELKLQAEIDPNGIQNGKGKLRTYKINPLPEKQKKLDIEFTFDRLSNLYFKKNGTEIKKHISVFPKHYIESIIPIVLENCTIILKKDYDQKSSKPHSKT